MITYKSTRGNKKKYTFTQALLKGIADDGGLFMPVRIPKLKLAEINQLQNKSYQDIAYYVMKLLQTDIKDTDLRRLIDTAYDQNFDNPEIAPLVHLKDNQFVLELWHGPTSAFKDMALQFMPLMFSQTLKTKKSTPKKYLILVATSGDTGAAALEGYKNKENIKIIVLFPENQVSEIQELTMTTFQAQNSRVYTIRGDFDSCQTTVKKVFNDQDFNQKLQHEYHTGLSAANSINWGRLVPQIFYYLSSYVHLLEQKKIKLGDEIDVAVPSGNFGNMFAAYFIKLMGLPIRKFLCASNANNILTEFFQTGTFNISGRALTATPSPSMNILVPNNLERLLLLITGSTKQVNLWMNDLKTKKRFTVDPETYKKLSGFIFADWVDNDACLACINSTLKKTDYLADPHTAIAMEVTNRFKLLKKENSVPVVICSTAHWAKFPEDVYLALFGDRKNKKTFTLLSEIKNRVPNARIPQSILNLQKKPKNKLTVYKADKDTIEEAILNFLSVT